eukprot:8436412-Pyramimonas_sp.AAC.1
MDHYHTARYTSTAEISTPGMACSTHSNHKHLGPKLLHFSFSLHWLLGRLADWLIGCAVAADWLIG